MAFLNFALKQSSNWIEEQEELQTGVFHPEIVNKFPFVFILKRTKLSGSGTKQQPFPTNTW